MICPPSGLRSRMFIRSLGPRSSKPTASHRQTPSKEKATRIRRGLMISAEAQSCGVENLTGFYSGRQGEARRDTDVLQHRLVVLFVHSPFFTDRITDKLSIVYHCVYCRLFREADNRIGSSRYGYVVCLSTIGLCGC